MFYDYRDFVVRSRNKRPPTPVVPIERIRPVAKADPVAAPAIPESGTHLAAVPIKVANYKKASRDEAYLPREVPVPGQKVPLAPCGVKEPRQIIKAAVIASQIAEDLLIGKRRIANLVEWRAATYFALRDLMPDVSRSRAARLMKRDTSTLIYLERRRGEQPDFVADKVNAIKEVLV